MNRPFTLLSLTRWWLIALISVTISLFCLNVILHATGFRLSRNSIDSGSVTLSAGDYKLTGNIGQPEGAAGILSQGEYTLIGGTFGGAATPDEPLYPLYLPIVLAKNNS